MVSPSFNILSEHSSHFIQGFRRILDAGRMRGKKNNNWKWNYWSWKAVGKSFLLKNVLSGDGCFWKSVHKEKEIKQHKHRSIMSNWQKDVAELKTDVRYIREDICIMQKQIRDLNSISNRGLGGLKVTLFIGAVLGAIYTFFRIIDWSLKKNPPGCTRTHLNGEGGTIRP